MLEPLDAKVELDAGSSVLQQEWGSPAPHPSPVWNPTFSISLKSSSSLVPSAPPTFSLTSCWVQGGRHVSERNSCWLVGDSYYVCQGCKLWERQTWGT